MFSTPLNIRIVIEIKFKRKCIPIEAKENNKLSSDFLNVPMCEIV